MTEQKIEMIELTGLHADSNLRGTTDCSINIQDPTDFDFTSGLSESDSSRNRCYIGPRDCRDVLGLFVLLTDTCLCIYAIIFVISLVIVFSIVVLAVVRVYKPQWPLRQDLPPPLLRGRWAPESHAKARDHIVETHANTRADIAEAHANARGDIVEGRAHARANIAKTIRNMCAPTPRETPKAHATTLPKPLETCLRQRRQNPKNAHANIVETERQLLAHRTPKVR